MDEIRRLAIQALGFLKLYLLAVWAIFTQCVTKHVAFHVLPDMQGTVAIVTGGNSGIGLEAVQALAEAGAHVILACRSEISAKEALSKILKHVPKAKVDFMQLDLASLHSVRDFVNKFLARKLPLHILINNAAVMIPSYQLTDDHFELQFGVNFLGHFLLTNLLLDALKRTGRADRPARVVNVASIAHMTGHINMKDLQASEVYSAHNAYGQSKLAVVMCTYELQRRLTLEGAPVTVNCLHPGIVNTPLYRHVNSIVQSSLSLLGGILMLTPRQGADTLLYLSASPRVSSVGGLYFDNCQKVSSRAESYDRKLQLELWTKSCQLVEL